MVFRTALNNFKKVNKSLTANNRGPKMPPKNGIDLQELANIGEQPAAKAIVKLKLETNRLILNFLNLTFEK
jgi:hypothetical protein